MTDREDLEERASEGDLDAMLELGSLAFEEGDFFTATIWWVKGL